MSIFKFNLRDKVRDQITGFTGVVVSRTQWVNGCIRYVVQAEKMKDGKPLDAEAFDEQQLDLVKAAPAPKTAPSPTGGPQRDMRSCVPGERKLHR